MPPAPLPPPFVARLAHARLVVEVGAGADFRTALAVAATAPHVRVLVTDIDPRVLAAPPPLAARLLDATRPDLAALAGADLVYAVRVPEELQADCARLADALGADLALRPLKDEWADLPWRRRAVAWPDGWRFFPR